jgi:hypothetical protein
MKASTQYDDLIGTVAADISDFLGAPGINNIRALAKYFNLDEERFEIKGISFYGREKRYVSLVCIDKERSQNNKNFVVKLSVSIEDDREIFSILFKRLHIVLHDKFDREFNSMDYNEESNFSDYHE